MEFGTKYNFESFFFALHFLNFYFLYTNDVTEKIENSGTTTVGL